MDLDSILVLLVLGGAVVLFATEKLPVDVVAVLATIALLLLGLVSIEQALSGFSNEATITVAAMFVLSAGLQHTGALRALGELLGRIRSPRRFTLAVMATITPVSAFVNNTATVAVWLPLVLSATASGKHSASKNLIPLSYAAQMGGVCTLIGTSTNLLVNALARDQGVEGFTLFEFSILGIACAVVGFVYLLTVGRWLLPERRVADLSQNYELGKYITELRVMPDSPLVGQTVEEAKLGEKHSVYVLELLRDDQKIWSPRAQTLREGDVLLARGDWSRLSVVIDKLKLEVESDFTLRDETFEEADRVLAEVMIAPKSRFEGSTLSSLEFRWHYNATVLALHRRGEVLREKVRDVQLNVGDVLLVVAAPDEIRALRQNPNLIMLTEKAGTRSARRRAPLALAIMAAVVAIAGFGLLPIVVTALLGGAAMVVLRCLEPDEAYRAIDWRVIVMLAGVLPLGIALGQTGTADRMADAVLSLTGDAGPLLVLATMYLLALVLSEMMSNAAAAVLLVPIAISTANTLGLDPKPLLVAITFAASTSFSTPVGYQTNTMVYNLGGYRFADFLRVGIPLNLLFWVVGMLLIPRIWPLVPAS